MPELLNLLGPSRALAPVIPSTLRRAAEALPAPEIRREIAPRTSNPLFFGLAPLGAP